MEVAIDDSLQVHMDIIKRKSYYHYYLTIVNPNLHFFKRGNQDCSYYSG